MGRHAFTIDMLRRGITTEGLLEWLTCKGELDDRDLDQIADTAAMLIEACERRKRVKELTKKFA